MLLFEAPPQLIQSGLWSSIAAPDTPLWADGEDILFRGGGIRSVAQSEELLTTDDTIETIAQASVEAILDSEPKRQTRIFFATNQKVYLRYHNEGDVAQTIELLSLSTANAKRDWSLVPYGKFLFATNGVETPYIWRGSVAATSGVATTGLVPLWSSSERAFLLTKLGPHLIAGNIVRDSENQGNEIVWSDADDPTEWTPDTTNTAGSLVLRDLESEIVAMVELGNGVAVFGRDSMGILSYIGGQLVFGFQRLFNNIGAISSKSVVSVGHLVFGMSEQGVWRTDGSTVAYVDEPAVREFIRDNVDKEEVVAFHDEEDQLVVFYYKNRGSNAIEAGIGYDYENGTWTRFKYGYTAASTRRIFHQAVVALGEKLLLHGVSSGSQNAIIKTKPLSLGAEERYKVVRALRLGLRGELFVRLGYSDIRDDYVFTNEPYHRCESELFLEERECVYLTLEFSTPSATEFQLNSIRVEGKVQGELL